MFSSLIISVQAAVPAADVGKSILYNPILVI